MSWENKFSSILRETEGNLSKARKKIGTGLGYGYNDFRFKRFSSSLPMRRASSLLDISSPVSPSMYNNGYTVPQQYGTQNMAVNTLNSSTMAPPSFQPSFPASLQEKIDQQNKLIDQLMQIVNKLECERNNYSEQIRDVKNEIYHLGNRKVENSPNTDHKIDQVRRDLQSEMQLIQSQLQLFRSTKGDSNVLTDSQLTSLHRDITDVKNCLRDDLELMRREMEIMKTRITKIEIDVSSVISSRQDSRRHESLDRSLHTPTSLPFRPTVNVNSLPAWNTSNRDTERMQLNELNELRSTVSSLKDKVSNIEYAVSSGTATPKPKYASSANDTSLYPKVIGYKSEKTTKANSIAEIDDLDLSDDESTDFEIFNPKVNTTKLATPVMNGIESDDEDLDLSDLDLSDDGSLHADMLDGHDL